MVQSHPNGFCNRRGMFTGNDNCMAGKLSTILHEPDKSLYKIVGMWDLKFSLDTLHWSINALFPILLG